MPVRPTKKTYHHGDLRSALIAGAEQLLAERLDWTFTLREVARVVGVSHNAPYNHFSDRRDLLAAVGTRGFENLKSALRHELEAANPDDIADCFRATARAYVTFAVGHPSHYRLMFSAELSGCKDAAFRAAGLQAFEVLQDVITRGIAADRLRADPQQTHALAAWSLVHGLGTLILDGKVASLEDNEGISALADAVASALTDGLRSSSRSATPNFR